MELILKAENIFYSVEEKQFWSGKKEEKQILKDISFSLIKGSIFGISGESGSGKTTLAKILTGILTPVSGKITFNSSVSNTTRTNSIQILFQNNGEILNPYRVIEDIITEALLIRDRQIDVEAGKEKVFKSVNFPKMLECPDNIHIILSGKMFHIYQNPGHTAAFGTTG